MNNKTKTLLIGTISGAVLGAALAWVASDADDVDLGTRSAVSQLGPGEYIALGISILTLARQFSHMMRNNQ